MSITITGFVFIIMTLYGLIFNQRFLYIITIFFLPFSATAVINVGVEGEGSSIQPYMFIGFFWMLSFYVKKISALKIYKAEFKPIAYLLLFTFTALISLIMPISINGQEYGNVTGKLGEYLPIVFSLKNITQFMYLLFGVLFSLTLYFHNKNLQNFNHTIKIYSRAIIFVIAWGILELASHYLGFKYPSIIFNNSFNSAAGGFGAVLDDELATTRIASVAVEASILTQTVIILLPFLVFSRVYNRHIFGNRQDLIFGIVCILFILRSTSTTGLLGLFFLFFTCGIFYFQILKRKKRQRLVIQIAFILPITIGVIYFFFFGYINNVLFSKGSSYSALERGEAISGAWRNFLNYPLLGTGWGSVSSFDLFVRIMSNVGIVGVVFFLMFILAIIRNQFKSKQGILKYYNVSLITSFATLLFTNAISGFSFTFGYFWLIIGLSLISKFKDSGYQSEETDLLIDTIIK